MVTLSSAFSRLASFTGVVLALGSTQVYGFNINANNNVVAYWGQNAFGGGGGPLSGWQQPIDFYCQDDSVDVFPVAFVSIFSGPDGQPELNLSNTCDGPVFPDTTLNNCQFLAQAIQTCQAGGKIVTISLGGEGANNAFSSDTQAQQFADQIWNLFLGGSSSTRPFGNAVLDGVDLDIEGGDTTYYAAMAQRLRDHFSGASKPYYLTGAPQCPFPDQFLGDVINQVAFDMIYVQFYNNDCEASNINLGDFNFDTWDNWAKTQSPNRNVKIFLGVPASSTAASQGFLEISQLTPIAQQTKSQFSSFGGVMMWDISVAFNNNRFDAAVKNLLGGNTGSSSSGGSSGSPSPSPPSYGGNRIHPYGDTSKCLDVQAAVLANGTSVQLYDCNGTGAQNWVINSGTTAVQVADTNFCLDAGSTPGNNVQMVIWTCLPGLAQQTWFYTGDQRIALQNQGQCLDVTSGSYADSTIMQTFQCTSLNTNQIWILS